MRVLDLPFTAVEWLLPSDMLAAPGDPLTPAKWMVWDRSPLAKERSLTVSQHRLGPALLMPYSCRSHPADHACSPCCHMLHFIDRNEKALEVMQSGLSSFVVTTCVFQGPLYCLQMKRLQVPFGMSAGGLLRPMTGLCMAAGLLC